MRLAWVVALGLAIVLGLAVAASTQNFAPPPPPPPAPTLPSASTGPPATICSTDYGWCPIQYAATSRGRYWPYDPANTSPYLNPHTGPPATLR
jgi:hypothetical protein